MKYIIIGASAAGLTAAKTLREKEKEAQITVIATDQFVHSRCMLHHYISGERNEKNLSFVAEDFFERYQIEWIKGTTITTINDVEKNIVDEKGVRYAYDKLLIATGAKSFIPPIQNLREAKQVYGLRDLKDAQAITKGLEKIQQVVVIGAGLVGLDAAYALLKKGMQVTVIEMADRILAMQLDEMSASAYQAKFEAAGCQFLLKTKVVEAVMNESGDLIGIQLDSGEQVPCERAIVAAGVHAQLDCLKGSGIQAEKAIEVDAYMQTNAEAIYAAGDVTGLSGIWPNAMDQGRIAACNMIGEKIPYEDTYAMKNTINFYQLPTLSIGKVTPTETDQVWIRQDQSLYQKLILSEQCIVGMIMQGEIDHSGIWQYLIKNKIKIAINEESLFDISFADFYTIDKESGKYSWSV